MTYEIRLKDGDAEVIEGADTYQQEGPLTTFFQTRPGRVTVDCWARRLASFRTADIVRIRGAGRPDFLSDSEEHPVLLRDF